MILNLTLVCLYCCHLFYFSRCSIRSFYFGEFEPRSCPPPSSNSRIILHLLRHAEIFLRSSELHRGSVSGLPRKYYRRELSATHTRPVCGTVDQHYLDGGHRVSVGRLADTGSPGLLRAVSGPVRADEQEQSGSVLRSLYS